VLATLSRGPASRVLSKVSMPFDGDATCHVQEGS
jgi:hypothetical protein